MFSSLFCSEDRIFLDANPLVLADDAQSVSDASIDDVVMVEPQEQPEEIIAEVGQSVAIESSGVNDEEGVMTNDPSEGLTLDSSEEGELISTVADGQESTLATNSRESAGSVDEPGTDQLDDAAVHSSEEAEGESGSSNDAEGTDETVTELIDPMIGEDFTFIYSFENDLPESPPGSGDFPTGYGPYIDLYFPTSGEDGSPDPAGSDPYDGIKFVSATYLGTPVTAVEQTFTTTTLEHAFAKDVNGNPVIVTGTVGDTFVSLQLPFGSYTPQQPAADIVITAHMSDTAEVDQPLNVTASSGFMFGTDPLDNPGSDPSLVNQTDQTTAWLPEVIRFEKDYVGPENETATGPNFLHSYSITVDVADGQTVDNLQIVDSLPTNIVYIPNSVSASAGVTVTESLSGGVLTIDLSNNGGASFTGGSGTDTTVTFDFYVADILPGCSTSIDITNDMTLEARWTPPDNRDPVVDLVMDAEVYSDGSISTTPHADEVIEAQPIVIQKSVADENGGDYKPGDIVEYTLEFQVSDYHALGNIEIQDLMSDGMSFFTDATHSAHFTIQDKNGSYVNDFAVGTDLELTPRPDLSDETQIDFHVSTALTGAGDGDGILEGGYTNGDSSAVAALGTITYYGQISEHYVSPDVPVDQGDSLSNSVQVSVDRFTYDAAGDLDLNPVCHMANADDSNAEVEMPVGGTLRC